MAGPHTATRAPQFGQRPNIRASDATVQYIANDKHTSSRQRAEPFSYGKGIQQTLGGMLVRTVTGIDHSRPLRCGQSGVAHRARSAL